MLLPVETLVKRLGVSRECRRTRVEHTQDTWYVGKVYDKNLNILFPTPSRRNNNVHRQRDCRRSVRFF